jgi:uncharacterized repeat protein (TIGR04138 family)
MLCKGCNQREASIHITQVIGDKTTKLDLCPECGNQFVPSGAMASLEGLTCYSGPISTIASITHHDERYSKEAYEFVLETGQKIWEQQFKRGDFTVTHISAAQMLDYLRKHALEKFGHNAKQALNAAGIFTCEDFGEIVFNLIGCGLLIAQPEDSKENFRAGYDFDKAFPGTAQ